MTPAAGAGHPLRTVLSIFAALSVDVGLLAIGLGGFGALLQHSRALALVLVWLVAYPTLAVLRPVRSYDPVMARRDVPLVMLTLFVVPLLTPLLSAWGERAGLFPLPGGSPLRWAGVLISTAGFAVRIAAMRQLGSRFSPRIAVQREHRLETHGLYARIRHPGYLGAWVCNLGIVLTFGSAVTLPLALLMGLALDLRVRREEEILARHFGEIYEHYRARTGRFLPRFGAQR